MECYKPGHLEAKLHFPLSWQAAHPIIGWLNQPLAQLPWFHCVPVPLRNPAPEIVLTLLLLILIAAVSRLSRPRQHLQPRG